MIALRKSPIIRLQQVEAVRIRLGGAKKSHFANCVCGLDPDGHVCIRLAGGGSIQDTGDAVRFGPEADTRQAARLYAQAKFGKHFRETDGLIERKKKARKPPRPPVGYLRKCALRGVPDAAELSNYGTQLGERSQTATPEGETMRNPPTRPAKERGGGWER